MNKYLRKHGKKIRAVLGILLVIAFALPSATSQYGRAQAPAGTLANGKVTLDRNEYNRYSNHWHFLKQTYGTLPLITALGGIGNVDESLLVRTLSDPQVSQELQQI